MLQAMQSSTMLMKCRTILRYVLRQARVVGYGTSVSKNISVSSTWNRRTLTDGLATTLAGIPCCSISSCDISCTWQTAARTPPTDRIYTTRIA